MTMASHANGAKANSGTERVFGISRTSVRPIDAVMRLLHGLFPHKRAAEIACRAGTGQRAAEHLLSGRNSISADGLVNLLRSDVGSRVLAAIMSDQPPVWWEQQQALLQIAELDHRQEAITEERKALKRKLAR